MRSIRRQNTKNLPPDVRKHVNEFYDWAEHMSATAAAAATSTSGSRTVTKLGATPTPTAGTSFADSAFRIYNNVDQTKLVEFDCSGITSATPRALEIPDADGIIALTSDIPILTAISDSVFRVVDNASPTKIVALECSSITAGNTRTLTIPDKNITVAGLVDITDAQLTTSDITTNDVSTSKHGFVPKAPNDTTKFLRGDATWAVSTGGDAVSVNGTAATDADFDDSTPAAPTGGTNVKWQKDSGTPNNISAYVVGVPQIVLTTGDQDFTAASLEDLTGLAFSVTSGVKYHFRFVIAWKSTATACGPRMSVTFPSVTSFAGVGQATTITTDGVSTHYAGAITSSDDPVIASSTPATGTWYMSVIEGLIVPSANGTLQARYGLETAVGSPTVTTATGSCGFLTVLG